MKAQNGIRVLLESARERHPSVISVDSDALQGFEGELRESEQSENTTLYIVTSLGALVFIATFPILFIKAIVEATILQVQLAHLLSQRRFLDQHPELLLVILFVLFGVVTYTLFLPSAKSKSLVDEVPLIRLAKMRFPAAISLPLPIKQNSVAFIGFVAVLYYLALLIPQLYGYSYYSGLAVWRWVTVVWLTLPGIFISCVPAFLLLFVAAVAVSLRRTRDRAVPRARVVYSLLRLISDIDSAGSIAFMSNRKRSNMVYAIARTARLISNIYLVPGRMDGATAWSRTQMQLAGDNFLSLGTWIYFPQPSTNEALLERLCFYLNIFLSGHYHQLPREQMGGHTGLLLVPGPVRGFKRILGIIVLAVYMISPIALFGLIVTAFHVHVPQAIEQLVTISYVIWVVTGFFFFSDRMAPEAKALLSEIIKSYSHKR